MVKENQKLSVMKEETLQKYIGMTKGVLTVLSLDHEIYDKEKQKKSTYFKVKCSRCGKESVVRSDRMSKSAKDPQACKHCINDLQREISLKRYPKETKHIRYRYYSIKGNAIGRNIKFPFSQEEVAKYLEAPCYYCGCNHSDGIDRIDSTKAYSHENCVPCCSMCNLMKNKYSLKDFLSRVEKIYNLHCNKSSTTISKESTSEANADGSAELLTAA